VCPLAGGWYKIRRGNKIKGNEEKERRQGDMVKKKKGNGREATSSG